MLKQLFNQQQAGFYSYIFLKSCKEKNGLNADFESAAKIIVLFNSLSKKLSAK
jgi:hypothetical protein